MRLIILDPSIAVCIVGSTSEPIDRSSKRSSQGIKDSDASTLAKKQRTESQKQCNSNKPELQHFRKI
ncbi:hypothetical protein PS15p_204276 [Mucor circinelloides]